MYFTPTRALRENGTAKDFSLQRFPLLLALFSNIFIFLPSPDFLSAPSLFLILLTLPPHLPSVVQSAPYRSQRVSSFTPLFCYCISVMTAALSGAYSSHICPWTWQPPATHGVCPPSLTQWVDGPCPQSGITDTTMCMCMRVIQWKLLIILIIVLIVLNCFSLIWRTVCDIPWPL